MSEYDYNPMEGSARGPSVVGRCSCGEWYIRRDNVMGGLLGWSCMGSFPVKRGTCHKCGDKLNADGSVTSRQETKNNGE